MKQNGNRNEHLACCVLERNGIKSTHDFKQFIGENKDWVNLLVRFKGMGPIKMQAVKTMVKRMGLET